MYLGIEVNVGGLKDADWAFLVECKEWVHEAYGCNRTVPQASSWNPPIFSDGLFTCSLSVLRMNKTPVSLQTQSLISDNPKLVHSTSN